MAHSLPLGLASLLMLASCTALPRTAIANLHVVSGPPAPVATADGEHVLTYRLFLRQPDGRLTAQQGPLLVYLHGSSRDSVLRHAPRLAGALALGAQVVVVEKRGVDEEGRVEAERYERHDDKPTRTADAVRVVRHYTRGLSADVPTILVGTSEGGDIAASVARAVPRVTHLVLVGCGGGWPQALELRELVRRTPGILGLTDEVALDLRLADIRTRATPTARWAGHSYKRWRSYLYAPPLDDVLELEIPVLLVHGTRDASVPVGSARALARACQRARGPSLRYREYADADHGLRTEDGSSLFPRFEIDFIEWLHAEGVLDARRAERARKRVRRAHPELFMTSAEAR